MIVKKSIALLIVSAAFLSLPGVARAGDINIQTDGARVTVGGPSGLTIQSRGPSITKRPIQQWRSPIYYRLNWFPIKKKAWIAKPTQIQKTRISCKGGSSYSYQSSRTSSSGNGTAQTYSSTSTKVCR